MIEARTIRIRPALPGDAAVVAGVHHRGWHAGHGSVLSWLAAERPPEFFAAKAPAMLGCCLVAEACGPGVVGFAAWSGAELSQLFVEPAWLGAGVGRVLLARAEEAIGAGGVDKACLTCVVGNDRARAFYLRHGWTEQGMEEYPAATGKGRVPVKVWRLAKPVGPVPAPGLKPGR